MYAVAKFTQTESRGPTKKYLILAKIVRRAAVIIDNYVRSSNHNFLEQSIQLNHDEAINYNYLGT